MTKAQMETNCEQHSYKNDQETKWKNWEDNQDKTELAWTNSTELRYNPKTTFADKFK